MTQDDKNKIIKCTVACPECGAEMVCTHEDPNTTKSTGVKMATSGSEEGYIEGVGLFPLLFSSLICLSYNL